MGRQVPASGLSRHTRAHPMLSTRCWRLVLTRGLPRPPRCPAASVPCCRNPMRQGLWRLRWLTVVFTGFGRMIAGALSACGLHPPGRIARAALAVEKTSETRGNENGMCTPGLEETPGDVVRGRHTGRNTDDRKERAETTCARRCCSARANLKTGRSSIIWSWSHWNDQETLHTRGHATCKGETRQGLAIKQSGAAHIT